MDRRTFIGTVGAGTVTGVAGCLTRDGGGNGDGDDGTLRIATYDSMVNTENSAGPWLKEAFEAEHDAEIEWTVPDQGLTQYVRSARENADIDADAYVGVNVDDLVRIDDELGDGELLQELEVDRLDNADRIRDELEMGDPHGRVLPYDTGYICLVYDETLVDEPETLADLTEPAYEDALLAQNAQNSDPGRAFLLWTIDAHGEDGYLDYWGDLEDNGVRVLDGWTESYSGAYMEGERAMVVSYSTDQVYANEYDYEMSRHQVAFPNGQGYANPEGMGILEGATDVDVAYDFFDFVLSSEPQAEIAQRNVQFPAVADDHVDLDSTFDEYAHEPSETVAFDYDALRGSLGGWVDDWAREYVSQ
ncbi:thiamine ABC transporter substrate binding subunit [Natrinema sp. H-ect1]|uniref:thiamine ABC transporter substrate-binding protein n=1 Tax=Natrinema sp. H-ect1 TaxID=3242700 RepID=UPI00359DC67F